MLLSIITISHDVGVSLVHLLGGDIPWYIMLSADRVILHYLSGIFNGSMGVASMRPPSPGSSPGVGLPQSHPRFIGYVDFGTRMCPIQTTPG